MLGRRGKFIRRGTTPNFQEGCMNFQERCRISPGGSHLPSKSGYKLYGIYQSMNPSPLGFLTPFSLLLEKEGVRADFFDTISTADGFLMFLLLFALTFVFCAFISVIFSLPTFDVSLLLSANRGLLKL